MNHMPGNLAYRAYQLIWEALDWLYPPNCGGCGQSGARWCKVCSQHTEEIKPPICSICGNRNVNEDPCLRCQASRPLYTSLRFHRLSTKGTFRLSVNWELAHSSSLCYN